MGTRIKKTTAISLTFHHEIVFCNLFRTASRFQLGQYCVDQLAREWLDVLGLKAENKTGQRQQAHFRAREKPSRLQDDISTPDEKDAFYCYSCVG
jgi:hypothetical protein